jgi:hypothetical protein
VNTGNTVAWDLLFYFQLFKHDTGKDMAAAASWKRFLVAFNFLFKKTWG